VANLLTLLPLAFVMVAGPQIVSAVFLATSVQSRRNSAAYIGGAALSITLVVTIAYLVSTLVTSTAAPPQQRPVRQAIDVAVIVLLLALMVYVFVNRKKAEPPRWMGRLEAATPRLSFTMGFLLLGFFPTDVVTSVTVGAHLAARNDPWWYAVPFILVTLLFLATPLLLTLVLGNRAREFLPKARDWMNRNSWVVNEIVIVFFLAVTISGGT
jgi:threonine/homoserine/homoserine lactone efflux protein